jgi:predicted metal-dependent hydrolase
VDGAAPQLSLFPPEDTFPEVEKPGKSPGFSVRESSRARRLSIKVYPRGKVEVVVPRRTRARDVKEFVEEHAEWIKKARASFAAQHVPEPFCLPEIIELPGIEKVVTVKYVPQDGAKSVRYRLSGHCLTLTGRVSDEKLCVAAIRRWLSVIARKEFEPRLALLSEQTGISYRRIQVRAQRTCWGSRSSSGTISLNLCLLFLRPQILRYLLIHELCHGRHMNHSKRFWSLVGRYEPQYRAVDKELGDGWQAVPSWLGIY